MRQLDEDIEWILEACVLRNTEYPMLEDPSVERAWQRIIELARLGEQAKALFAFDSSLLEKKDSGKVQD